MSNVNQHTINKEASISGIGLHTGKAVRIKFKPAEIGSGITFVRSDLPGHPRIKAELGNVSGTVRGTKLGEINTVEHVLSALYAFSITNVEIELDGAEPPSLDGSSKPYCDLIIKTGITDQKAEAECIEVKDVIFSAEEGKSLIAVPSDRFEVSYMINYPMDFIGTQLYKFRSSDRGYIKEIAPARTYGFIDEVEALKSRGLAMGADAENAVAIDKDGYQTKLRFRDELVRHKILDLIGYLSLTGVRIKAHIIGIRSGHALNIKFAKKLASLRW